MLVSACHGRGGVVVVCGGTYDGVGVVAMVLEWCSGSGGGDNVILEESVYTE